MKKIIITALILFAVTMLFVRRTVGNFKKLYYSFDRFKLNVKTVGDIAASLISGFDASFTVLIRNTTGQDFKADSVYLEVYTIDGNLIARPKNIINAVSIPKNSDTKVIFEYSIDLSGLFKMMQVSEKSEVVSILKNYIKTGYLGKKVRLKGNAKKSFATVNLDFEVEV
jgi:hypothetical protein